MNWQTVYVFISSTFNDMHAERDYLVKQVFPELRMWCARRKLKLVDVDLRWGVSAADAQENKRVVEVCMKNIDKCRPFFLCFLGQRRGWVPKENDVNSKTLELFPELQKYLGNSSITELEVLHALIHPLSKGTPPVDHARFYFRNKDYLKQIKTPFHRNLFFPKHGIFSRKDSDFESFKNDIRKKYHVIEYTAKWNAEKPSPELSGDLANGRLEDFRVNEDTLGQDVLTWLMQEIEKAYPEHTETYSLNSPLALELDNQDIQLFQSSDGYIPRPHEEKKLMSLIHEDAATPIMVIADAGCGKTSLLAHMINQLNHSTDCKLYYRFVGTTPQTFKLGDLAASLVNQWISDGILPEKDGMHKPDEMSLLFPNLIVKAGQNQPFILILDGMDQLIDEMNECFLPHTLPNGCKLIFSLRSDTDYIPDKGIRIHSLGMMNEREDKVKMVNGYLNTFLKNVDDTQLERIITMAGSSNPLYMKIILNELRQHGSFDTLFEMLNKNYGTTPLEAFCQVILRIKKQLIDQGISEYFADIFFGCLACTHEGIDGDLFYRTIRSLSDTGLNNLSKQDIYDLVYGLSRELEPFLVLDGNKLFLRYDSLRRAHFQLVSYIHPCVHSALSIAFAERAMNDNDPHYMECAMYHITNAIEDFIPGYFQNAYAILWLIRHNGSKLLADTFHTLAYDRGFSVFENPAQVISHAGARLDTYPETLFMELRRYGDTNNLVIKNILENEKNYKDKKYLIPLNPPGTAALLKNEYALPKKYVHGMEYNAPYYILFTEDIIKVVNSRNLKLINLLYTESRQTMYDSFRIKAGNDLLYLIHLNKGRLISWKCYSLPNLNLIEECNNPDIVQTSPQNFKVVNGKLYALYVNRTETGSNKISLNPSSTSPSLVCINTKETLFSASFSGDCHYKFLGEYLILRDTDSGNWCIIRTIDGKVLIKDTFLGYDHIPRINMYAGGANLYAGIGKTLCVWLSGANLIDGKLKIIYDIRNYHILENGELELAAHIDHFELSCSCVNVLSSGHIIIESQGVICVLDEQFRILGYYDLGETIQSSADWSGKFYLSDSDTLLVFHSGKIQKLSFNKLLASLKKDYIDVGHTMCDGAIRNGWFYVFGPKVFRTNLETLERQTALGSAGYIERICPWNIGDNSTATSTAVNGKNYTFHDLELRRKPNRYTVNNPNKYMLLHAFYYMNKKNDMVIGNIVADRTPCYHTYQGKEETFFRCSLHLLLEFSGFPRLRWKEFPLNIDILGAEAHQIKVETIITNNDAYVVLPNIYKNEQELELCVYQASTAQLIYSHTCPVKMGLLNPGKLYCCKNGLVFGYRKENTSFFAHLDLKKMCLKTDDTGRQPIENQSRDGYVYLRKAGSWTIDLYSLEELQIVKSFTLTEHKNSIIQQIITVNGMILIQNFNSDILEAYDFESGEKLFDQRMEQIVDNLYLDSNSNHIAMLDTNQRVYVWKTTS